MQDSPFLPGVPVEAVTASLRRSPGNELASGKFASPESSAALAVNAFGWFLNRPADLPPLPGVPMGQPSAVEIEAEMHFPWRGGRHPWLDVALETATTLVGVESKRYEPFRPQKSVAFTEAFARDWGTGMAPFDRMRRTLSLGQGGYRCLDAAQLVKHAFALHHQAQKRGRGAVLVYLYAEPAAWASGKPVDPARLALHREEIARFANAIHGASVTFAPLSWASLLEQWASRPTLAAHAAELARRFGQL